MQIFAKTSKPGQLSSDQKTTQLPSALRQPPLTDGRRPPSLDGDYQHVSDGDSKNSAESVDALPMAPTQSNSLKNYLTLATRAGKHLRLRLKLHRLLPLSVNSGAGKYTQFLNGSVGAYPIADISNSSEFNSLSAIFDEIFIRKATFHYVPVNLYSANAVGNGALATAAGAPGLVNSLGMAFVPLQHNQAIFTDSATAAQNALSAEGSRWFNTGDVQKLRWVNNEKFTWDGTLGDQTTSLSSTAWMNITSVASKYGGLVQWITPEASGAAAGIGTLVETGVFGHVHVEFDVCYRARS